MFKQALHSMRPSRNNPETKDVLKVTGAIGGGIVATILSMWGLSKTRLSPGAQDAILGLVGLAGAGGLTLSGNAHAALAAAPFVSVGTARAVMRASLSEPERALVEQIEQRVHELRGGHGGHHGAPMGPPPGAMQGPPPGAMQGPPPGAMQGPPPGAMQGPPAPTGFVFPNVNSFRGFPPQAAPLPHGAMGPTGFVYPQVRSFV